MFAGGRIKSDSRGSDRYFRTYFSPVMLPRTHDCTSYSFTGRLTLLSLWWRRLMKINLLKHRGRRRRESPTPRLLAGKYLCINRPQWWMGGMTHWLNFIFHYSYYASVNRWEKQTLAVGVKAGMWTRGCGRWGFSRGWFGDDTLDNQCRVHTPGHEG